jgi:hypothetical protein
VGYGIEVSENMVLITGKMLDLCIIVLHAEKYTGVELWLHT